MGELCGTDVDSQENEWMAPILDQSRRGAFKQSKQHAPSHLHSSLPANTTTLAELKSSPTPAAVTDSSATRTEASEAKRRTAARLRKGGRGAQGEVVWTTVRGWIQIGFAKMGAPRPFPHPKGSSLPHVNQQSAQP